jgi:AraC family carnitine catabolism transcriptional activator
MAHAPHPQAAPPLAARLAFLVVPRFNMGTLISMIEVARTANYLSAHPLYEWEILSFDGPQVVASNGLSLAANPPGDRDRRGETVFALASWGAEEDTNRPAVAWLRRQARAGARVCAVELGIYLLARAGLLEGRRVTTHWSWAPGVQERFPDLDLVERLYTLDDTVMTCAGGLAGVDLMLRLLADAHGEGLAGAVADQMLAGPGRTDTAPQRRTLGHGIEGLSPPVRAAIALIESSVAEPLPVPALAARLGLSQRQLERRFKAEVGCTVVQFGLLLRLQHARVLLIATRLSVREIAAASGFDTLQHFSASFARCFGRRPSAYRQGWPKGDPAPSWPGTLADFLRALPQRAGA